MPLILIALGFGAALDHQWWLASMCVVSLLGVMVLR